MHYISQSYIGLNIARTCYPSLSNEDLVFFKFFVLLYADDTVILAENDRDLQMALDSVHEYCTKYKLTVNTSKTKIMIFSRGKVIRFLTFKYGHHIIEVVSDNFYFGANMNYNNNFAKAMKKQLDQGRKTQQLITYWFRLLTKDGQTFAYIVYMIVLKLFLMDEYKARWLSKVKCILDNCDLSYYICGIINI